MGAEFLIGPLTEATGVALKFLGTKAGRILSGLATKDSSTLSSAERETKDKLIEQLRQGEPAAAAVFDKLKSGGLYVIEDVQEIDAVKEQFLSLNPNVQIFDFRSIKNRKDDIIIQILK